MAGFRKRVYAGSQGGRRFGAKRRRFVRRRRGRGRGTTSMTQFSGATRDIQYRSRRMGIRRWRRMLWRDTMSKQHYRSVFTKNITVSTPATIGSGTVSALFAEQGPLTTNGFWQVGFGAQPSDVGVAVPLFDGDITLRGGRIGLTIAAGDLVTDQVLIKVWLVFTNPDPDVATLTGTQPLGWDPSSSADFATRYGKVLLSRQAYLSTDMSTLDIQHRLKPRKIDRAVHGVGGRCFVWIIQAINLTTAAATTVRALAYFNLSFSGDSVGTT